MILLNRSLKTFGFTQSMLNRLEQKAQESGYWSNCAKFVKSVNSLNLTAKQQSWLAAIVDDLQLPWE